MYIFVLSLITITYYFILNNITETIFNIATILFISLNYLITQSGNLV